MIALSSLTVEEALRLKEPETELEKRLLQALDEDYTELTKDLKRTNERLHDSLELYRDEFHRLREALYTISRNLEGLENSLAYQRIKPIIDYHTDLR